MRAQNGTSLGRVARPNTSHSSAVKLERGDPLLHVVRLLLKRLSRRGVLLDQRAELRCVTSSISVSARLICSRPVDCSALAAAMPDTISATCLIESTISLSAVLARLTRPTPS